MDIQNSELLPADVDHPDVVEQITISTVHTIVVADIQNSEQLVDVLNRPLFVVDTLNTDLRLQVVEVLQVVDVNTINL